MQDTMYIIDEVIGMNGLEVRKKELRTSFRTLSHPLRMNGICEKRGRRP